MPLSDPRPLDRNQVWPPTMGPEPDYSRGPADQSTAALQALAASLQQTRDAVAIQREALIQVLGIDEAQLHAAEKAIYEERTRPKGGLDLEAVQQLINQSIGNLAQAVDEQLQGIVKYIQGRPSAAAPPPPAQPADDAPIDPMTGQPEPIPQDLPDEDDEDPRNQAVAEAYPEEPPAEKPRRKVKHPNSK